MKSFRFLRFATLLALLALTLSAAPALALPRPCDAVCDCGSTCILRCTVAGNIVTSCGSFGICNTDCFAGAPKKSDSSVLLSAIFAQPADASAPATPAPAVTGTLDR